MEMATATQGVGGGRQPQTQSLARQGSMYSLNLSEVHGHLGEPLPSMNLDELLRIAFPDEENQSSATDTGGAVGVQSPGIQGSITMLRALSKKAVDEVCRHIHQGQKTLGEMTLEDFLSKHDQIGDVALVPGAHWLQQQQQQANQSMMRAYVGRPVVQPPVVGTRAILDAVYHEGGGANSSPFHPQIPRRKRGPVEDMAKKTVERRKKRMIKNRESAARSRVRKQAYTNELEKKVSKLEEENQRLRQQMELEAMIHYVAQPEPKHRLGRTSSTPF